MAESQSTVSRRSFIVGCGVAAAGAATAAPLVQRTIFGTDEIVGTSSWPGAGASRLAEIRAAYLAEVERFAEELAPRFARGELRAFADGDSERYEGERYFTDLPMHVLENLCGDRFGCRATRLGFGDYVGPVGQSFLVLAVSPHAEATEENFHHISQWAQEAISWDVITVARARGYYTMAPGEYVAPHGEVLS